MDEQYKITYAPHTVILSPDNMISEYRLHHGVLEFRLKPELFLDASGGIQKLIWEKSPLDTQIARYIKATLKQQQPIRWADVEEVELGGIDRSDFPDLCDVFIERAIWIETGEELDEDDLRQLHKFNSDKVYEEALEICHG